MVHLENHVKTKQKYPGVTDRDELAELTLQEYGDNLHIALTSENNENRSVKISNEVGHNFFKVLL